MFKNVNILEFGDCIWNHHKKCIQISIHLHGIGSLIRECEKANTILLNKTNARVLSVKAHWAVQRLINSCITVHSFTFLFQNTVNKINV